MRISKKKRRKLKEKKKKRKIREAVRKVKWIMGHPHTGKEYRGLEAEKKVEEALEYHRKKKTKFPGDKVIVKVRPTFHHSESDKKKVDTFVDFQDGETLRIQIKNWWRRWLEEELRKEGIILISVRPSEDKYKARERSFRAISSFLLKRELTNVS